MSKAFIIGNGESRLEFNLNKLKNKGIIYGCNAIYRDHPRLCDRIVSVNDDMYNEVKIAKEQQKLRFELLGWDQVSKWNYKFPNERMKWRPEGVRHYRTFQRGKKTSSTYRFRDFSTAKGSGCSAVLHAAERGYKNVIILGFDILGKINPKKKDFEPWQNNVYKNSDNYPTRDKMKTYLAYEWLFQLTQIFRKYYDTDFYMFNTEQNWTYNPVYKNYFAAANKNIRCGTYQQLSQYMQGDEQSIDWLYY